MSIKSSVDISAARLAGGGRTGEGAVLELLLPELVLGLVPGGTKSSVSSVAGRFRPDSITALGPAGGFRSVSIMPSGSAGRFRPVSDTTAGATSTIPSSVPRGKIFEEDAEELE